ncbi:MAG TPA: hypothetical protein VI461_12050 [Chitinophagaceae bacterium]|nr:hypothetical protein [Chitinophagaceae bacterium]
MVTAFDVDGYRLSYRAKTSDAVHLITLCNGTKAVAELYFRPDGTTLPSNEIVGGVIRLIYHFKDFQNIFDIVLRVRPLKVVFNSSSSVFSGLTTPQIIPL